MTVIKAIGGSYIVILTAAATDIAVSPALLIFWCGSGRRSLKVRSKLWRIAAYIAR